MPKFEYSEEDRERWASRVQVALGQATLAVRERMAAALADGVVPSAEDLYDPEWWDAAMEAHVNGVFYSVAYEAAELFALENQLDVDEDWLIEIAILIAAGAIFFISSRSDVIKRRATDVLEDTLDTLETLDLAREILESDQPPPDGGRPVTGPGSTADEILVRLEAEAADKLAETLGVRDGAKPGPVSEGIARTISTGATTHLTAVAADEVIRKTEVQGYKIWNCLFLNSRDSHMEADGQKVAINELFKIGDSLGRYPGDPDLPIDEVANCNCWLTYEIVEPAVEIPVEPAIAAAAFGGPGSDGIAAAGAPDWLTEIETTEDSVVFDVGVGGPPGTVTYREAVDPEWGNHALVVTDEIGWPDSSIVWRGTDGGIEGLFAGSLDQALLVQLATEVAVDLGDEPPGELVEVDVYAVFGGPGSGPRPGHKSPWYERGSKKKRGGMLIAGGIGVDPLTAARAASKNLPAKAAESKARADAWLEANPRPPYPESIDYDKTMPPEVKDWVYGSSAEAFLNENPRKVAGAKARATKNFREEWETIGGITPDEVQTKFIQDRVDQVGLEPKMQRAAARFGKVDHVVALGDSTAAGAYIDRQNAIGINSSSQMRALHQQYEWNGGNVFGNGIVGATREGMDMNSVVRHEYGHKVHYELGRKDPELKRRIDDDIVFLGRYGMEPISDYAAGYAGFRMMTKDQWEKEAFAEAFAAVAHPTYDRSIFPTEMHTLLERVEGLMA